MTKPRFGEYLEDGGADRFLTDYFGGDASEEFSFDEAAPADKKAEAPKTQAQKLDQLAEQTAQANAELEAFYARQKELQEKRSPTKAVPAEEKPKRMLTAKELKEVLKENPALADRLVAEGRFDTGLDPNRYYPGEMKAKPMAVEALSPEEQEHAAAFAALEEGQSMMVDGVEYKKRPGAKPFVMSFDKDALKDAEKPDRMTRWAETMKAANARRRS